MLWSPTLAQIRTGFVLMRAKKQILRRAQNDNLNFTSHDTQRSMSKKAPKKKGILRCPTCRTLVTASGENFPFCSDRCRQVDLGKWASGVYRISSPILDPEVLEDLKGLKPGRTHDEDE